MVYRKTPSDEEESVLRKVDLSRVPTIYVAEIGEGPNYAIDLYPEDLPTIGPFRSEAIAHGYLIERFGEEQHRTWYPSLYDGQPRVTCDGCGLYVVRNTVRENYCAACRSKLKR